MSFDLYTIIFLVLAVFIFFRLRSVLGQRTGQERPPEPMRREPPPPAVASDKVIPLPTRNAEAVATPAAPPAFRWQGVAPEGSELADGLRCHRGGGQELRPQDLHRRRQGRL